VSERVIRDAMVRLITERPKDNGGPDN